LRPAARCLRVAAAFLAAARCLRVAAAFFPALFRLGLILCLRYDSGWIKPEVLVNARPAFGDGWRPAFWRRIKKASVVAGLKSGFR